ncbi:hypothetical protein YC2023_107872 [Brassica napus]
MVEILNCFRVSLSQISPLRLKHLVGTFVLGYKWEMDFTADNLEIFFGLSRTGVEHLYSFKPHHHMEIVKGFATSDRRAIMWN